MELALNGMTLSGTDDLESTLRVARELEIRYLELWAHNCEVTGPTVHPYAFRGKDIGSVKRLLEQYRVRPCCVAFGGGFDRVFSADRNLFVKELVRAVEVAAELECGMVNHYCGHVASGDQPDWDILEAYWGAAVRRAEQLGITLVLENEAHDVTKTPENTSRITSHFDTRNFLTNFDGTNYYQAGVEPFPYAYRVLEGAIAYVHLKNGCIYEKELCPEEACVGEEMSRTLAGRKIYYTELQTGAVNISGILHELSQRNYVGFCTLEPHMTGRKRIIECLNNDIGYLRSTSLF